MTRTLECSAALTILLFAASPGYAGPCAASIAKAQAKVDAAIERSANSNGWRPESLDALRGDQPTPRSLAETEGHKGFGFEVALDSLDRAREADHAGDTVVCRRQLTRVMAILRQQR